MLYTLLYFTLSTLVKLTGTMYIVNVVGETYFPDKTVRLRSYLMWQGLKVVTLLELQAKKYITKGKSLLDTYFPLASEEDVHFIRNGLVVKSYKSSYFFQLNRKDVVFPECDFILLYFKIPFTSKYNYQVFRFPDVTTFINSSFINCECFSEEYKPSTVKFLSMKLNIQNDSNSSNSSNQKKSVDINFGIYNFIINQNILFDRPFVKFYLKTFHEMTLKDHEDYEFSFIGPDMEINTISDAHYIELVDNKYHIRFIQ